MIKPEDPIKERNLLHTETQKVSTSDLEETGGKNLSDKDKLLYESISETSKNASQVYILYLSFLAYCSITILTISDEQILFNQSTLLPLVNLNVSSIVFFIIAPMVAIGFFISFQFYLCRLMEMLHALRKRGVPLEKERLYPWLINFAVEPETGFVGELQKMITEISLWWLLPLVLALFALWALKKHIVGLSVAIGVIHILGTWSVVCFWRRYQPFLSGIRPTLLFVVVLCFETSLLGVLYFWVMTGYPGESTSGKSWITPIKNFTAVNLSFRDFGSPTSAVVLLRDLNGVNLEGAQFDYSILNGAKLSGAHLQSARLKQTKLKNADLTSAQLQQADLSGSDLSDATLAAANLTSAFLANADLTRARLVSATLTKANLVGAKLKEAQLQAAHLEEAVLESADLEGANLRSAVVTLNQLSLACTLFRAQINDNDLNDIMTKYAYLREEPKRDKDGKCLREKTR